jgi:tripartite-type tricarboxylate transporter receptor subunit TctC
MEVSPMQTIWRHLDTAPAYALAIGFATSTVLACQTDACAQTRGMADAAVDYPTKPIRIIAQFQAGTTTDLIARVVAQKLTDAVGRQVIVDNRPGAGGRLGTQLGANATPDGYTLTMGVSGAFGIAPALYSQLPYDAVGDFAPVTNVVTQSQVLVTSPASPVKTVDDLVRMAKVRPGELNYGSVGPGTATHLSMEMLQSFAKIKLTHVPFKGSSDVHSELIRGDVLVFFDGLPASLPLIKSGRLRAIAVSTAQRQLSLPELPTVAESGYPGFAAFGWAGIVAPAKTPVPVLDKLNRELVRIVHSPETKARFIEMGNTPVGDTRAEFAAFIKSEIAKWTRIVKEAGVKVDQS